MENVLVLVRHGESEWNKLNLFTGWRDVGLTETGTAEAHRAGKLIKAQGFVFDIAYTSALKRAQLTLEIMLEELGQQGLETIKDQALNERDYGDLSGLNKDDARKRWGDEMIKTQITATRRSKGVTRNYRSNRKKVFEVGDLRLWMGAYPDRERENSTVSVELMRLKIWH